VRRSQLYRAVASAVLPVVLGLVVGLVLADGQAHAAITGASGRVEASVQQIDAATGTLIDQAFEETPGTTNILPAQATATLDIVDSESIMGTLTSTASVNPPADVAAVEQTKDFSLEAAGLSQLADRGYLCDAKSTENRQVVLGAEDLGLDEGTRVHVRSTFVISAGVFLVTLPESAADIDGTVSFVVRQLDNQGSHDLLGGSVRVFFDNNKQLQIENTGDASLVVAVPFDFSGRSEAIDQAHMILLPFLSIPYEYDATVGTSFTLTAEVEAEVNAPSGAQGGSAFLGQVPTAFLEIVSQQLEIDFTSSVGGATGSSATQQATGLVSSQMEITVLRRSARCGDFGLESLLGGLLMAAALVARRFA
jgi:hypothetical protein